jgi:hypothetical protein
MKHTASANASSRSRSGRPKSRRWSWVLCVENTGYPASLETGKAYRALAALKGQPTGTLRVIDEDGEDYLYDAERFIAIDLPPKLRQRLAKAMTVN